VRRWFLPTKRGDARAAIVMTVIWAVLSALVSTLLSPGDGGWLGWVIAAPIFGVLVFVQLRRRHGRAAIPGTER
jgi:fatty acid desaturase